MDKIPSTLPFTLDKLPDTKKDAVDIRIAKVEDVTDDELRFLAFERTQESDLPGHMASQTHAAVEGVLNEQPVDSTVASQEEIFGDLKKLLEEGKLIILRVNEKVAGTVGIEESTDYKTFDQRRYWSITRAVIAREFRGRGLLSQLRNQAVETIQEKDKDAAIWLLTRNPKFIRHLRSLDGWHEAAVDDLDDKFARQRFERKGKQVIESDKKAGYVYFIFDPKSLPASPGTTTA